MRVGKNDAFYGLSNHLVNGALPGADLHAERHPVVMESVACQICLHGRAQATPQTCPR
jgi:hypothetical protein